MLKTLRIRNLATIEELRVEFVPGLNVLTGETGAGKSIVIDALGLAAGLRGDSALVRTGADRAVVEAEFEHAGAGLAERGLDADEGRLIVRRELSGSGSGRVTINGSPATVGVLRELGAALVDLHGQHDQRGLLSPELHLDMLDAFGGHDGERAAVGAASKEVALAEARVARVAELAREGGAREAALRETVREIRSADPKPGELAGLTREREILKSGARVSTLLASAIARLDDGEPAPAAAVRAAEKCVSELALIDPDLAGLASRLESSRLEIEDVRDSLIAYRDAMSFEPDRLEAIESRRVTLERLLLKWGPGEEDLLREALRAETELLAVGDLDAAAASANRDLAAARAGYDAAARVLTERRTAAAKSVLVFDEVDAGVSGRVALAVGARLARLAKRHQVLCVTHLPQVAAHASGHFHVSKCVVAGRTHTVIAPLVDDARVDELARMLGGRGPTSASRDNAAELLAEAGHAGRAPRRS